MVDYVDSGAATMDCVNGDDGAEVGNAVASDGMDLGIDMGVVTVGYG